MKQNYWPIDETNEIALPCLEIRTNKLLEILEQKSDTGKYEVSARISDDVILENIEQIKTSQKLLVQNPLIRVGPVEIRFPYGVHAAPYSPILSIRPDEMNCDEIAEARALMRSLEQELLCFRRSPSILYSCGIGLLVLLMSMFMMGAFSEFPGILVMGIIFGILAGAFVKNGFFDTWRAHKPQITFPESQPGFSRTERNNEIPILKPS